MKIVVIIPTYNEVENITRLIPELQRVFSSVSHHDFHVLVIDGNSPDGTSGKVRELSTQYPNVHLLVEEKKAGLGAAYILGFKHAMEQLNADVLMEMDADFQHDPNDVPRLIAGIDDGADYVIGSRFTKGGSIPQDWAFYRKMFSVGGNWFSKIVLLMFHVNDFTSGFKASRVKGFADSLNYEDILSKGFAYKIHLLYKMHKQGAKIKEIPITFGLRDRGDSKMERNNLQDSLKVVLMIRLKESATFIKFMTVGMTGLISDTFFFNLLRITLFQSRDASAVSGLLAMMVTFALNNFWSFGDRRFLTWDKALKSFLVYGTFSYIPILFRSYLINAVTIRFGDTLLIANGTFLIGIFIGMVWNFTIYSKIIWKKRKASV